MTEWLRRHLVCPRDRQDLRASGDTLVCPNDHAYPVVDDVPVMLVAERERTHGYIESTLQQVAAARSVSPDARVGPPAPVALGGVDGFVQGEIVHTCGNLYVHLLNKLTRYPIPDIRLPRGDGARLLDVGCNWGRWSISAAMQGYRPVGIDPSLEAVFAARRVCRQLQADAEFVVGDARWLPFAADTFDVAYSCGVFQHFSKGNARTSLGELARVVKPGSTIKVQMPNKYGLRSLHNWWRRGLTEGERFEVRYWTPSELLDTFRAEFGATDLSVHGYFGLGVEGTDIDLLPLKHRAVVRASEFLRRASRRMPFLAHVADSLYLTSTNQK